MKFRLPTFTRREFITTTTSAGAIASASSLFTPNMLQTARTPVGKKGQAYPNERRSYKDSKSGKTVWQLTNLPAGRKASYSYYNVPKVTPDERWALYISDRASAAPGQFNIFKMDLRTGESVQITESSDVETTDNVVMSKDGKQVYFFDTKKNFRVVDFESFKERTIGKLPENAGRPLHNSSLSSDGRTLISSRPLEPEALYTYMSDWALHHALIGINTDNGQMRNVIEGQFPIGINEFCPANDNLILWDVHGGWEQVHRPWVYNIRDGSNVAIMPTIKGEGSGHQYWGWTGAVIYSVLNGGRYPQGIWAVDWPSLRNERCVAIGGTHAHAASSPNEDVHVQDEVFGKTDALFFSRKGSAQYEVLCQIEPWMELVVGEGGRREWRTTPYHPHHRFMPSGTKLAFNGKANNAGNIWYVEL
ncbi:MAG: hypothetical protein HY646_01035 [Acidobacteria bacterium]|nr:hypothetical protein [Acidobacteriota bacterium]